MDENVDIITSIDPKWSDNLHVGTKKSLMSI